MMRFTRRLLLLAAVMASILSSNLLAQGGKTTLHGTVTDSSGSVLQGASIELQPSQIVVTSDRVGSYFVNDLPPGAYTITVSYVGFSTFTKDLNLTAGQSMVLDISMVVSSQNDQVLVTSDRASGEADALNRQRTADNVLQVLPADVIRSLPNANMADAIGRLPSVTLERDEGEGKYVQIRGTEPRLTNGTIDGVSIPSPERGIRQIKFDTIPADLVESVEINKTLQANQDGDGIGGSVNLVTKSATDRPTVALYGLGGISPINGGRNNYETTATVGKRFGSDHRLGALIGGSYDWNGRGIDDTEPVPDLNNSTQRYFDSADLREYRYYRTRWGLAGSADYKLTEGSDIYVRGIFSSFHNFGDRWVYTLVDNTPNANLTNGSGGPPSFNTSIRRPRYLISSLVLGGKHVLSSTWFTWDIAASRASEDDNGYGQANFNVPPMPSPYTSPCTYDPAATGNSLRPLWNPVCFTEAFNTSIYALSSLGISRGKTAQGNLEAAGAVGKRYHVFSHLATIEVGGKFRNAHKYDHTYADNYTIRTKGGNGSDQNDFATIIPFSDFPSTFNNNHYYGGTYKFGPAADYYSAQRYVLAHVDQFDFKTGAMGNANFYNYIEQVSAGYVMNTLDFNKFRFVAGLRTEGTNLDTLSWQDGCTDPTVCTTIIQPGFNFKAGGNYISVLPSASLRYAINTNTDIRLAFSRGLSRPNSSDIAQSFSVSPANGPSGGTVSLGNLNLKPESANNYDLLFEHYLTPFGAIQAGVFYKQLSHPIVQTDTVFTYQPSPQYPAGRYIVSQAVNAGTAHLYGFEISYVQRFNFLPGMFGGLGLSANYGYTDSGTTGLYNRLDHPHLLRQAPHTWNISPTFDRGRVSIRLGMSYNDANIFAYQYFDGSARAANKDAKGPTPGGPKGPNGDTYLYSHFQFDAQGSVRLAKGFTFIAYGLNLNNEVFGFYNGSTQYLIQREYYTPTYGLGLRWSPTHER